MPKSDFTRHSLFLYEGDYARMQALFPELGAAHAIRRIVREFLERAESGTYSTPNVEVDL